MPKKQLLIVTLVLAGILTAARTVFLPIAAGTGTALTKVYYPLLLLLVVAVAVLLLLGRDKTPHLPLTGSGATAVAAAGLLFGALMLGTCGYEAYNWAANGKVPAPNVGILNAIDRVSLTVSLFAGVLGGLFLIAVFVGWRRQPYAPMSPAGATVMGVGGALAGAVAVTLAALSLHGSLQTAEELYGEAMLIARRNAWLTFLLLSVVGVLLAAVFIRWLIGKSHALGWMWLLPVLWLFARTVRYDVSYATSVDISPAVYDLLLFAVALLFLLAFAQYVAGVLKPTRFLRGLAASTAALSLAAVLSRVLLRLLQETVAYNYCPLTGIVDVGLGLFALAVVVGLPAEEKARHVAE